MSMDRRTLVKSAAFTAVGPFAGLAVSDAVQAPPEAAALVPVRDQRDGVVRLHLPPGFNYRSFHDTEAPVVLTDGTLLPGRHDGMGAFAGPDDSVILVRNHEVNNPRPAFGPTGTTAPAPYDAMAGGGTTTVQVTRRSQVIRSFTSLNGTMMNCSGGQMPWGAWVTCEETVNGPDVADDFTRNLANNPPGEPAQPEGSDPFEFDQNRLLEERHGYIFEVPTQGYSDGQPIRAAGRFSHEAVAYDPKHGDLYLTEDDFGFPSGFYRYSPQRKTDKLGRLDDLGRLQMLAIKHQPNAHLEEQQVDGTTYEVEWVDIEQPDFDAGAPVPGAPPTMTNDQAIKFVASQGWAQKKGAAYFSRLEGAHYDNGSVYFTSTQGGGAREPDPTEVTSPGGFGNGFGQVWAYDIQAKRLRVVYQSPGKPVLDLPDNITVSPRGTLVLCEDNNAPNYVRGLSQPGHLFDIALNRLTSAAGAPRFNDEFAGSTFSPDGEMLFVNIQAGNGMTFAIWGPWSAIGV